MGEMSNGILQYQVQNPLNCSFITLLTRHFIIQLVYQLDKVLVLSIDLRIQGFPACQLELAADGFRLERRAALV